MSSLHVVAGALIRQGTVLIARRPLGGRDGGLWEFPGGKVEPGETSREALIRELREELGVEVAIDSPLGTVRTDRITLEAFVGRIVEGEPTAREHLEIRWARPEVLQHLKWPAADRPLLPRLRAVLARATSIKPTQGKP